jgi:DNA-binding XRE family transcriptional regulator
MLFNPITLAIAGTVAGLVSLKYMWDTITYTTKDYKTATEQTEYWQDKLTGAVSATEVAVKSYDDYVNASKNTELQQIYAKKDLADKQNAYAQALRDSTKSADELRAMELEVELAEAKVKDATKAHEDAVKSIDEAIKNEQTSLAHQIQVSEQSRIQKLLEKGSYDEVMTQIGKLAQTEYSYTDSHGNVMKTTEKQTATWAALTLTKLAEQDKGFDSYLSNMGLNSDNFTENLSEMSDNFSKYGINIKSEWDGVNKSVKTLVDNTVQDVKKQSSESMFKDAGKNVPFGVKKGIEEGSGNAFSAISAFGSSLLSKLKASLKEKSPSKATAEMGEFLMQGLSNGIDNNASTAISSAVSAAKETMAAFSAPLQDFSVPDLSADISRSVRNDVFSHVEVDSVFDGLSKPVVLELDGQVLGKFNIDFINDQSFIRNATVINI